MPAKGVRETKGTRKSGSLGKTYGDPTASDLLAACLASVGPEGMRESGPAKQVQRPRRARSPGFLGAGLAGNERVKVVPLKTKCGDSAISIS